MIACQNFANCFALFPCLAMRSGLRTPQHTTQVFYEPTALARCREGSTILLRLCAAVEAFDVAINADQSALDSPPRWQILEEEDEWDRRAEASAIAAESAATATPATQRTPAHSSLGQAAGHEEQKESMSWFQEQQQRQRREEAAGRSSEGGWAASALSEIDQV